MNNAIIQSLLRLIRYIGLYKGHKS
jgi:hypothetical protein